MATEPSPRQRHARTEPSRRDGALRRLRAAGRPPATRRTNGWLQVNLSLFPRGPGAPPYVPWAGLATALAEWRAAGRFSLCFFMRKAPGLRLRFYGADLPGRLEPELLAALASAERRNDIRAFRQGVYEPETHLFGGPTGMALAHRQFDLDTRLALGYETLTADDRAQLGPAELSLALMSDLFGRCLDDVGEIWDVWQRLRRARDLLETPALNAGELERAQVVMAAGPAFEEALSPAACELLHQGRAANERTAAQLRPAVEAGRLTIGPRAWLMAACIFHWNRLGLDADQQVRVVAQMVRLLDPHAEKG